MDQTDFKKLRADPAARAQIQDNTSYLPPDAPLRQRIWHVEHDTDQVPLCMNCEQTAVKWSIKTGQYSRFCSSKCAHSHHSVRQKTQQTCLERFGTTTNLKNTSNKAKQKKTLMDKYGVDNFAKTPEFKEKYQATCQEKYGVTNASKLSWVKQKIDHTHQVRYQRKRSSQAHLPKNIIDLKNDAAEMRRWFFEHQMPVTEIARLLGVNHSQLCVHFKNNLGIDISRHRVSTVERQVLEYLTSLGIDHVHTSDRKIIPPREIDIVLPDFQVGIEINGLAWHSELRGRDRSYHVNKMLAAREQGYRLIQITDWEWNNRQDIVKSRLSSVLKKNHRIWARDTEVRSLDFQQASDFIQSTHIQGRCAHALALGLCVRRTGELVAVMTFGRARFSRSHQWELIRYSSKLCTNVIGGAGKLFAHFVKNHAPDSVISYCDLRYNTGNVYSALGFHQIRVNGPNYWYTHRYQTLENRMQYQKHRLRDVLPKYDADLTEWENMMANGYDRIWDCGNLVYSWKCPTTSVTEQVGTISESKSPSG